MSVPNLVFSKSASRDPEWILKVPGPRGPRKSQFLYSSVGLPARLGVRAVQNGSDHLENVKAHLPQGSDLGLHATELLDARPLL